MAFKLPRYSELTDSQRIVVNLPYERNHIIKGAPGTGKSVIAIYRASDMCNEGYNVLMLVYNRPLMSYISSAVESLDIDAEVNTWQSWIYNFYWNNFGSNYPQTDGKFTYNWDRIKRDFESLGKIYDHVIIDEAQDVPVELIEALLIISDGVSCFMDVNQTLSSNFTDYQDVAEALGVRSAYTLYDNFRNPKEIFDFAKLYNPNDIVDPIKESGSKPEMIQCSGYGNDTPTQLTSRMIQVIKRNFGLNYIGVFTNPRSQKRTYEELSDNLDDMDVFMYKSQSKDYGTIDFDEPGVYVLTFNTMKGLEFDAVLLPRCECINKNDSDKLDRNMFYVAVTRASEKLFCFYFDQVSYGKYIDVFTPIRGNESLLKWEKC